MRRDENQEGLLSGDFGRAITLGVVVLILTVNAAVLGDIIRALFG